MENGMVPDVCNICTLVFVSLRSRPEIWADTPIAIQSPLTTEYCVPPPIEALPFAVTPVFTPCCSTKGQVTEPGATPTEQVALYNPRSGELKLDVYVLA